MRKIIMVKTDKRATGEGVLFAAALLLYFGTFKVVVSCRNVLCTRPNLQ